MKAGAATLPSSSQEAWWELSQSALRDLFALSKPGIVAHCVLMAGLGAWLGSATIGLPRFIALMFGVGLIVAGANAMNMYRERHIDRLMDRTRTRPLPSERVPPHVALYAGISWGVLGLFTIYATSNPLTTLLAAIAYISYVFVYTPLKRKSWTALLVGTIPGAMPPLLGWTGTEGTINGPGIALFLVLTLWQIPHFIAIAVNYAEDYRRGGIRVIPLECGEAMSFRIARITAIALMFATLLFPLYGIGGIGYLVFASLLGVAFIIHAFRALHVGASRKQIRGFFFATLIYLPVFCAGLVLTSLGGS